MTGHKAYRGQQVKTSSPLDLVILTYEVLVNALYRASEAQKQQDFVAEADHAQHAMEAISELINGLDYDLGGEIASNLGSLYVYTTQQILAAQGGNDEKAYTDLIGVMNVLRSGWMELRDQQRPTSYQNEQPQQQRVALAA